MRGRRAGLAALGRAQALAGATAVMLLVVAVIGVFAAPSDPETSAVSEGVPPETSSTGTDGPSAGPTGASTPGQATLQAPATDGAPGSTGPSSPAGGSRRGPASGAPVRVGIHVNDNQGAASSFGVGGLPDISNAELEALTAQVNAAGGLAGRPIEPVIHRTDPLNGSFDTQGQAACETFTDDNDTRFVIDNALSPSKVVLDCLSDRKIPLVWELHMAQTTDAEMRQHAGYIYRPSMPSADRLGFVVDALVRDGFFRGAKVALLRYDSPEGELMSRVAFRPALKEHGVAVVAERAMRRPANSAGATGLAGESSNAVLDFKEKGVTHVVFIPTGGAIPLTFLPAAASQAFYPRYAFSSQDAPAFIGQNFPADQLDTSRVVGWAPNLDGHLQDLGPSFARCQQALRDAGLPWDQNVLPYCDAIYFLHEGLYDADAVSPAALRSGVDALGDSFDSPFVIESRFGPGRYDGPSKGRLMRYDRAKEGWSYFGSVFDIG